MRSKPILSLIILIVLAGSFLPAGTLRAPVAQATAAHTIAIDGDMSDWAGDEDMEVDGTYGLYLTWDTANLYLGLTGAYLGDTPGQDKSFFVCFDTNLTPGSGAAADGYGNVAFNVNLFAPEYCYYFAGGIGWYEWTTWTGSSWNWNGWRSDGTYYNWPGNPAPLPGSELTIIRSEIGNPTQIGVVAWLTPEESGTVEASWPTANPVGAAGPTLPLFYHFPSLVEGISPDRSLLADHIVINEFHPKGTEWVELYNPTAAPISLQGWYADDVECGSGTSFIGAVTIDPGAYYTILANAPGDNFDLENSGDIVVLCNASHTEIDRVAYGNAGGAPISHFQSPTDNSTARTPNGTDTGDHARDWNIATTPTQSAPNNAAAVLLGSALVINEAEFAGASSFSRVELYNPTAAAIVVTNWLFTDGDAAPTVITTTPGVTIPPGGFFVFRYSDQNNGGIAASDVSYLFTPDKVRVDQLSWNPVVLSNSAQRVCDGDGPNDGYNWVTSGGDVTLFDLPSTYGSSNVTNPVDMAIAKDGPAMATIGATIDYVITYYAPDLTPATSFFITDTLPPDVAYVTYTAVPALTLLGSDPLVWSGTADCGRPAGVITITVQISTGVAPGTILTNTAEIQAVGDVNPDNDLAAAATVVAGSEVSIAKAGPDFVQPGQAIAYTLTYQVQGNAAESVVITDVLPGPVTYLSDNAPVVPSEPTPGTWVWNLGTVPPGLYSFAVHGLVSTNPMTWTIRNRATITATNDTDPDNNEASFTSAVEATDLSIEKTGPALTPPGGPIAYTLAYQVLGEPAQDVVITDVLPLEVLSPTATPPPTTIIANTLVWQLGTVAAPGSIVINGQVDPDTPVGTELVNTVFITTSLSDIDPLNNTDRWTTTVGCEPPTAVDFTSDSPVFLGQPMHFSAQADGTPPFTYQWDFGGPGSGSGLDGPTPVYTYSIAGTFTVLLTVTNDCGSATAGHDVQVQPLPSVVINEFDAQTPGTDAAEFIELYDGGVGYTSLDGLVLVFFNGDAVNDASYYAIDLDGYSTDANGYFVAGNAAIPGVDLIFPDNILQNGQDAIGLFAADGADFPNGTPVTNTNLIDAVVYDDYPPGDDDPELLATLLNPGQPMVLEGDDANNDSAGRCPNGSGGPRNTYTYIPLDPSPKGPNNCPLPPTPDAAIAKSGPPYITADGGNVDYVLTYEMTTAAPGQHIVITDTLPAGVTFVTFTSLLPVTLTGSGPVVFDAGSLPGLAENVITLTVSVPAGLPLGTRLTNTVQITCSSDTNAENNTASFTTLVVGSETGLVSKTGPAFVLPGQPIAYTLTYQVLGEEATGVVITDVLPGPVAYLSDTAPVAPSEPTPGTLVWELGTVPAGLYSFAVHGLVSNDPMTWTIHNQAEITASNDTDPDNNHAAWDTQLPMPIQAIQYTTDPGSGTYPSPRVGQSVWTIGAVIADESTFGSPNTRIFIQDPRGDGPWDGILLYYSGASAPNVDVGDLLLVYGTVAEYSGATEINTSAANTTVLQHGVAITPTVIPTADLISGLSAESYEWVLIEFRCATVTNPDLGGNEWGVTDASGQEAIVDDWAPYSYSPVLGDVLRMVRGVGNYYYEYKLAPRGDADLALAAGVTEHGPVDGNVPVGADIWATFNISLSAATVNTTTFFLEGPAGLVSAVVSYDAPSRQARLDPVADLEHATTYTATLTTGIESEDGQPLCADYSWTFTTEALPAPDLSPSSKTTPYPTVPAGGILPYTIELLNSGELTAAARITDVLPAEVTVLTATLPPELTYDDVHGWLLWNGEIAPNQPPLEFTFQVQVASGVPTGTTILNTVWIDDGVNPPFTRTASVQVSGVAHIVVSPSALSAILQSGQTTARSLTIQNSGQAGLFWLLSEAPAVTWLAEVPTFGQLLPGEQSEVTVNFDAAGLGPGIYTTTLAITHTAVEPLVVVQVTLQVTTGCVPVSNVEFSWSPPQPVADQPVTFNGTAEGLEPIAYAWDFGDGYSAAGATVVHTYASAGDYTVVMTATNCGGPVAVSHIVHISAGPQPQFKVYLPVIFKDYGP